MNGELPNLIFPSDRCYCPNCGYKPGGKRPVPCHYQRCPRCGSPLADQ